MNLYNKTNNLLVHIGNKPIDKVSAYDISDLCYDGKHGTDIWRKHYKELVKLIA